MAAAALLLLSSCTSYQRTIADSNSRVNFTAKDWAITAPYGGQASVTKILGIDFARLFTTRTGASGSVTSSIPIIGSYVHMYTADDYAMYDLLQRHPGFDAAFYPQFKRKSFNFLGIYSHSTSEVKARLGKLTAAGASNGDSEGDDK